MLIDLTRNSGLPDPAGEPWAGGLNWLGISLSRRLGVPPRRRGPWYFKEYGDKVAKSFFQHCYDVRSARRIRVTAVACCCYKYRPLSASYRSSLCICSFFFPHSSEPSNSGGR